MVLLSRVSAAVRALVSATWLLACAGAPPAALPAPREHAELAIQRMLDAWHRAAAAADEARYFSHFAPTAVFMGTDRTERWTVAEFRAYAHPFFARGKAWSFTPVRRSVTLAKDGTVAWFDEDLATPNLGPARGSGVLLRDADRAWKIVFYNLAITVPNERMKAVKAVIEGGAADAPRELLRPDAG